MDALPQRHRGIRRVIPRANVTAWRSSVPWSSDSQVEQDLVLCRGLVSIFSEDSLAMLLAFRGGTELHKLHLKPPARYSEDIDLVQRQPGPIKDIADAIRAQLAWLGEPSYQARANAFRLEYRFSSEIPPVTPLRLKIEIDTREHFSVLPLRTERVDVRNPWSSGGVGIPTFDLDVALQRGIFEPAVAVRCFGEYLSRAGLAVSRAEFEENLARKMDDKAFREDIDPLLVTGTTYDPFRAYEKVKEQVLSCLPGEGWRGRIR